nr:MAG TPA: hypothetical protein [Crassvirales sp.]
MKYVIGSRILIIVVKRVLLGMKRKRRGDSLPHTLPHSNISNNT